MTEAEEQALHELGSEVAAALHSPWEPRCVARAFASGAPLALTMQQWIDLDHARSPLLQDALPATAEELTVAAEIFALDVAEFSPQEAADVAELMLRAVRAAFALALPMRDPGAEKVATEDDGFGTWLPLWAALVTQCGLAPDAALALRVDRAYALLTAHRRNQGWEPAGEPYALRDLVKAEEET